MAPLRAKGLQNDRQAAREIRYRLRARKAVDSCIL